MRKGVVCRATPIFRNRFTPLAVWQFVESRRSRLVAGTDKETPKFAVFFQPLPLTGLPLSRFTRRGRKDYLSCPERTNNTGLIKNAGYAISHRVAGHGRFYYTPRCRGSYSVLLYFVNTIFVITILFLFLLFLSVHPLCNKPLHSRPTVFQHNTLFIFCRV